VGSAAFAFLPGGRIVYGERPTGRIMLLNPTSGKQSVMYKLTRAEGGLRGFAVDPDWPTKRFVYAYSGRDARSRQNQILKIEVDGGKGVAHKVIWRINARDEGAGHDGGHIDFGPDGKLYAVMGDRHDAKDAQDLTNDAGKVLRMNRNGSVPSDNPISGSRIFSYGLRNSFGFAFDPQSGTLWETDNGPQCMDEINVLEAGSNHAWGPNARCRGEEPGNTNQDGPEPRVLPLVWFTPTIAPTGLAFCEGCGIAEIEGSLVFGAYNTGEIREIELTPDRTGVASMSVVFDSEIPVLSIQAAPDGGLYFSSPDAIYHLVEG
jgi:glucose/arabinose dehydrogenase